MPPFPTLPATACAEMIAAAKSVIALTGAGISTAAGIPDFRGPNGLYTTRQYDPETVFDIDYFRQSPDAFYAFSRDLFQIVHTLRPTFTHSFLANLEREGKLQAIITQNIDPLHEMAGSQTIIAVHGSYHTSRCLSCGKTYTLDAFETFLASDTSPRCDCPSRGIVKPDVVFFGEAVHGMEKAQSLCEDADLMLVLGSSLQVYPAAWLPDLVPGAVVAVNRGDVGLKPGANRFVVDEDLDTYFKDVANALMQILKISDE